MCSGSGYTWEVCKFWRYSVRLSRQRANVLMYALCGTVLVILDLKISTFMFMRPMA